MNREQNGMERRIGKNDDREEGMRQKEREKK
jgi:hypothetical protein